MQVDGLLEQTKCSYRDKVGILVRLPQDKVPQDYLIWLPALSDDRANTHHEGDNREYG